MCRDSVPELPRGCGSMSCAARSAAHAQPGATAAALAAILQHGIAAVAAVEPGARAAAGGHERTRSAGLLASVAEHLLGSGHCFADATVV